MSVNFRLHYAGIRVTDLDRSLRFYTEILGMSVAHRGTMQHGGEFVQLKSPGSESILELNWYPRSSRFYTEFKRGEELDHLAFLVKDVKRAFDWLVGRGIDVAVSPRESEGTEVYIKDPDGVWIELLEASP
jgi:lactoylglutathione lyase